MKLRGAVALVFGVEVVVVPQNAGHPAEARHLGQHGAHGGQHLPGLELQIARVVQGRIHEQERDFDEAVGGLGSEVEKPKRVAVGVAEAKMLGEAQGAVVAQAGGIEQGRGAAGLPPEVVEAVAGTGGGRQPPPFQPPLRRVHAAADGAMQPDFVALRGQPGQAGAQFGREAVVGVGRAVGGGAGAGQDKEGAVAAVAGGFGGHLLQVVPGVGAAQAAPDAAQGLGPAAPAQGRLHRGFPGAAQPVHIVRDEHGQRRPTRPAARRQRLPAHVLDGRF